MLHSLTMGSAIIEWLLEGDVSIQYQVHRDLLGVEKTRLRKSIESEGWGLRLLSRRSADGHWGRAFYQPKWTSTHYTLLDLKNLNIYPANKQIRESLASILSKEKGVDGGINPSRTINESDVCLTGMVLNYACYFRAQEKQLMSLVDFLLVQQMRDGGFNCRSNRSGAVHSSLHSTLSVLEGIAEYERNGYTYQLKSLQQAKNEAQEFILMHRLFRSDRTGKVISPAFLRFSYPCRWRYDILKALDYFQSAQVPYDPRMDDALEVLMKKRNADGKWKLAAAHPGETHIIMEKAGKPSRWNTLRALRVLKKYPVQ